MSGKPTDKVDPSGPIWRDVVFDPKDLWYDPAVVSPPLIHAPAPSPYTVRPCQTIHPQPVTVSYTMTPDPTRGYKKMWALRRKDVEGDWTYWTGQKHGFVKDLIRAELYDRKPSAMGDEETVEVEVMVSLA